MVYGALDNQKKGIRNAASTQESSNVEDCKEVDRTQQQCEHSAASRRLKPLSAHCHLQATRGGGEDKGARTRLIRASLLCLIFMICEIIGGYLANSLAIATDAAHLLADFASFMVSLFALLLAERRATARMSFGWHRAEVMGALVSVLMIWLVTGLLVYCALERLRGAHFELDSRAMVATASAGLIANIFMAFALNAGAGHSHGAQTNKRHQYGGQCKRAQKSQYATTEEQQSHCHCHCEKETHHQSHDDGGRQNINVRAAFIHVLGDLLQSAGVLIAALVIYFEPSYTFVDPLCTFLFSFIVLLTTINIIWDVVNVLMEGVPDNISLLEVNKKLLALPHVIRVHNLRIWSLSLDKVALAAHLVIDEDQTSCSKALRMAIRKLEDVHDFHEITLQVEEYRDDNTKCCDQCNINDYNHYNQSVIRVVPRGNIVNSVV